MRIVERFEDYCILWELKEGDWPQPEFKVLRKYGEDENGEWDFEKDGNPASTTDVDLATVDISGFIKWDNCGHFKFPDSYHHICGKADARMFSALICYLFKRSAELWGENHIDYRDPDEDPR